MSCRILARGLSRQVPRAADSTPTWLSLGLERHETDGLLKRHKVVEDLPRAEELADQIATLRRVVGG
jgi:DNA-binding HxlR family transcriptional regulator